MTPDARGAPALADDVLDECSTRAANQPTKDNAIGAAGAGEVVNANEQEYDATVSAAGDDDIDSLTGTATSADEAEPYYAGAGNPDNGNVQDDPGSQVAG